MSRRAVALVLAALAVAAAVALALRARAWNEELAIAPPIARVAPIVDDPHTPRLADRVVLVVIDGLGADEAKLPFLDELRARGADATARVPYPTVSRPNYVTILTGVPPRDSGVRANRVLAPVAVDTVMDRAHAAGLRVASASDFGSLTTLFFRGTRSLGAGLLATGTRVSPPPPITWPFDVVHRASSLDELGRIVRELAASDAALVAVLVLDVDRAGHAEGVGERYRAAALDADRMLRDALRDVDLTRDAILVTADHGHVAPGGHGGTEREVSRVPLVLAGSGIRAGAAAPDAPLIDVAPTIAALLGIPAPGHAEGRALVELLALDPAEAARRRDADDVRGRSIAAAVHPRQAGPDLARGAATAAGLALSIGVAIALRRRRAIALSASAAAAAAIALLAVPATMVAATRGHLSPSYVPSLAHLQILGAIAIPCAIAVQLAASWLVIRRVPDRLAAASGLALIGLALALGAAGLTRTWWSPPFYDVPPPAWMVLVPTVDLAAATAAAAIALLLVVAIARPAPR